MFNEKDQVTDLEPDLLLLLYTFCDQHGKVNVGAAQKWAKDRLGVSIPAGPHQLTQQHIDILVAVGAIPDISSIITRLTGSKG